MEDPLALTRRSPGSDTSRQARARDTAPAVCQPTVLVLLILLTRGTAEPLLNLHADNFDRVIEQHDHVVVHFWAPGMLES